MEYRRCQPPCARFIANDGPHSKYVWGFRMHARRFTGYQNANFVKISVSEPSALGLRFLKMSHAFFPVAALCESATWGSDVELEAMESEQMGLTFSLPLSPENVRTNSLVEFAHYYLYPSPEARDTVSFGLDDVLLTAASDSEDFGPALADAFLPDGQESQPSAAYSKLVDVLSRATEKLSLDWPDEPRESQSSKHFSVQCFTLHPPKQRRRGLSFVMEDITSPRPSQHPKSVMSSSARHSGSSIAFLSRMGASTRGIALGSLHSSVRLHTSVWVKSPLLRRGSAESSK